MDRTIERQTFENQTVALDGHEFSACMFVDCDLTWSGGTFSFTNGTTIAECSFYYGGPVAAVWAALNVLNQMTGGHVEEQLRVNRERPEIPPAGFMRDSR